jgi:hypothetical protein
MSKQDAGRLALEAQTEVVQAAAMLSGIPHVENRDRALHYLTNGLEKLARAVELLADDKAK